jgi:hypothetical protein
MQNSLSGALLRGRETVQKVIPFYTGIPIGPVPALLVEALKLVQLGAILRIYFAIHRFTPPNPVTKTIMALDYQATMSMLKATYALTNVRFSVVSLKPAKILICGSYFSVTSPSPKSPVLVIGSESISKSNSPYGTENGLPNGTDDSPLIA